MATIEAVNSDLSIEVSRPLDVEIDLGHLLVTDTNEVSAHQLKLVKS